MAAGRIRNAKALNAIMRVTTQMLKDANEEAQLMMQVPHTVDPPPAEAVDCEALTALINAAQEIYIEHCPGP